MAHDVLKILWDLNQGTCDEHIKNQIQISWDNAPLNPNKMGHLKILCVKWSKNTALQFAEHWWYITGVIPISLFLLATGTVLR